MERKDYQKRAELLAGLLQLSIKEGDFSKLDEYISGIKQAIDSMRKSA